jgi:hypothetical protein
MSSRAEHSACSSSAALATARDGHFERQEKKYKSLDLYLICHRIGVTSILVLILMSTLQTEEIAMATKKKAAKKKTTKKKTATKKKKK